MTLFVHHFEIEEADELLPELRELVTDVRAELARQEAEGTADALVHAMASNGGGDRLLDHLTRGTELRQRLERVVERGIQIKDLRRGLFDFPALRNGEEVLLCWMTDEPKVAYWHDLETGFAGRQRIDPSSFGP